MSNKIKKPKLSPEQLITKMKTEKGISFNICSESDAIGYLSDHNNYLRTGCYRVCFPKYQSGSNKGKYIQLDFAHLQELSVIDMHYRFLVRKMCSDIEHALCMMLLNLIDNDETTDGYDIVEKFLDAHPYVVKNLERSITSPHTGDLINKYFTISQTLEGNKKVSKIISYDDCPAWVLVECLTFGDLLEFFSAYSKSRNIKLPAAWSTLNLVRSLRNGSSHDVCLLCYLPSGTNVPSREIINSVKGISDISASQRQKKLSSRTLHEFAALLFLYDKVVSGDVRRYRSKELCSLFYERIPLRKELFMNNPMLLSSYNFCCKLVNYYFVNDVTSS